MPIGNVREQILSTASELFYREGVHAVGIDTIIAQAGVAKSSLYRHFGSKDELIAAYVQSEDDAFWQQWDRVVAPHQNAHDALLALVQWIGTKIGSPDYRGCPQLNVVAEFPDETHPARRIATNHKAELRRRLTELARRLAVPEPEQVGDQLWLLIDGAFANHDLVARTIDPVATLVGATTKLMPARRRR
jgi:AcrR family transcriptional regulator